MEISRRRLRCRYFNPHEREARDFVALDNNAGVAILIHTSVKLVTSPLTSSAPPTRILIHTSVKLVTGADFCRAAGGRILIHTSVKLVTGLTSDLSSVAVKF